MRSFMNFILVISLMLIGSAFASEAVVQVVAIDYGKLVQDLIALITNYKVAGPLATASGALVIIMEMLKKGFIGKLLDGKPVTKTLVIVLLGQISGVLIAIVGGVGYLDAAIQGLFASGGAMAIWSAVKPMLKK